MDVEKYLVLETYYGLIVLQICDIPTFVYVNLVICMYNTVYMINPLNLINTDCILLESLAKLENIDI